VGEGTLIVEGRTNRETIQGHSDKLEGGNAEWRVISALQKCGYELIAYSHHGDTIRYGHEAAQMRGCIYP
jgi:hypothetical protein